MSSRTRTAQALSIRDLNVFYGQSHALQGVDLTLERGVLSVVGRNGMGKTTMCKAIMGMEPVASGSIAFHGQSIVGSNPTRTARLGVGYVPQGRRLWPSLTVDEHLRLVARRGGAWNVERIYAVFPRLAERKSNRGGQLSGGEQQMLAIGRALLLNPRLLVMDEPTEGLAPVIVTQVQEMLIQLGQEGDIDVLLIEQNIGVACAVADRVAIMVNGRINRVMDAAVLAGDRNLQQTLLGVGRHSEDDTSAQPSQSVTAVDTGAPTLVKVYLSNPTSPTRWTPPVPVRVLQAQARTVTPVRAVRDAPRSLPENRARGVVYVCGTLDTKRDELVYVRDTLAAWGVRVAMVDLSTSGKPSGAEVPPHTVASFHPRGASAVHTGDRGTAVAAMTVAFERWVRSRDDIAGLIGAGGSGGTALLAPGFRVPPVGVPKFIVSTVASGGVGQYVGPADISMMYSVADIQGLNSITRDVLANAANAIAGMVKGRAQRTAETNTKRAIGLSMFGVTTPCIQGVTEALDEHYDCLVFHATGTGGRSMEALFASGKLNAVLDLTTTEICDLVAGGVFAADNTRFDVFANSDVPYIGACGALDMVNFNAPETVPAQYRGRVFYEHNPQITLMRTSVDECVQIGRFIGEKLNRINAPVRFYLPEGGVSLLDAPGQPFWDPNANAALFDALESTVLTSENRQVIRVPHNINDPAFIALVTETFRGLHGSARALKEA